MKLIRFSVSNYRSIKKAHDVPISETTVIVGKNNEGKSNVLKALSIAMNIIANHATRSRHLNKVGAMPYIPRYGKRDDEEIFDWDRDFPILLKERAGRKQTVFILEFELTEDEIKSFRKEIKSNLNGTLPLKIVISSNNIPKISVVKSGRGHSALNEKSEQITSYIAKRISFNYIPAVRTHKQTLSVIEDLLTRELRVVEANPDYKAALKTISDIQKPVLNQLSEKIKEPLSEFLPNIKKVQILINEDSHYVRFRRDFNVIIDDGTPTGLEYKGDGVKSLAALGLLKNRSYKADASIIAIEEPESHLHPGAIHQLQEIINSIAGESQVVLTTHNPLFINRQNINSNILVDDGKVVQAKNIESIRDMLGVRVSDNLIHARYILVVEGKEDKISLEALLPYLSLKLAHALKNNLLKIEHIGGAGNLSYKLSMLQNQLCTCHVFLDNDTAAQESRDKAFQQNLLGLKNLTQALCPGMKESEFEDCLDKDLYDKPIYKEYGINLDKSEFRGNKKWSTRMKEVSESQGKVWNDSIKQKVKMTVAQLVVANPAAALSSHKRGSIDGLISSLEQMIDC